MPPQPISIGFVRNAMRAVEDLCGPTVAQTLALLFTELVTNAIRHAGLAPSDVIDVTLSLGDRVEGAVRDPGVGFEPDPAGPQRRADGGFGLYIVHRLARSWGVRSADGATEVWFEI